MNLKAQLFPGLPSPAAGHRLPRETPAPRSPAAHSGSRRGRRRRGDGEGTAPRPALWLPLPAALPNRSARPTADGGAGGYPGPAGGASSAGSEERSRGGWRAGWDNAARPDSAGRSRRARPPRSEDVKPSGMKALGSPSCTWKNLLNCECFLPKKKKAFLASKLSLVFAPEGLCLIQSLVSEHPPRTV